MEYGMPFLLETRSLEDAAALCRDLGLSFVELNMNFPQCGLNRLKADALNRLKDAYGIYFTLHFEESLNPFDLNPLVREAYLQTLRGALKLARAIEAPVANLHLPKGVFITLPNERVYLFARYAREYTQSVLALRALCEREADGSPLLVCVENTDGFAGHEKAAVERLLESPVFGLTLDIGHSHAARDADLPFYQTHGDRLRHMHAHDARGTANHQALGSGEIDLPARLEAARSAGARVVLETKTVEALRASIRWLSQFPEEWAQPFGKS